MSLHITDCTIRDGGYLLSKNSPPEFVSGVMQGLADAGIDFVETGFLQNQVNGESLVYHNAKDARRFLPERIGATQFCGFCDNSRYSVENLEDYDGGSFKWLRISFAKHEQESALQFCKTAKEKGYIVQFNPMDALSYTVDEHKNLFDKVNDIKPGSLSIVDTFGAMYLEDIIELFKRFDSNLDSEIKIGLHSHDNLGLSCALAETMIMLAQENSRGVIVDGSLFGMGRGAGNAPTELIASYLNKKHGKNYNVPKLLETIDRYIMPLKQTILWGYDLPMFICGTEHAHVDNINYLQKNTNCSINDIYSILSSMPSSQRTRYGKNYSKTDFSDLHRAYELYRSKERKKKDELF